MENKKAKTMNEVIKSAAAPVAILTSVTLTACSGSVQWADAEQGVHDLVIALISFASSALGIVSVWVLSNLKGWLDKAKAKKEAKEEEKDKGGDK